MSGSDPKLTVRELLEEAHPALVGLSHWIHANPELGFEETLASGWVAEWLTTAGFKVTTGAAGMPTAVVGSTGPGPLHVVVCVEYDALPVVGHACGHNVIAAAGVGAGVGLASVAEQLGLRVTVMGTPAEEGGGGKLRMIDAGLFSGVHAAVMVHPWPSDIEQPSLIAARTLEVTYLGREAHAGAFPYLGINAADALVVAQTAIGLLRQHLLPTDRVHGIVTKGGDAVNVVPAHTTAQFMVRATTRERLDVLTDLVRRCFEAGSTATGSELAIAEQVAYSDMRHDPELAGIYRRNAEALGRVFDDVSQMPVSTDMGDVSYVVPSIHPMIGIDAGDAVNHQAAFAEACASPSADRAVLDGAVAMAWTVIDAASDASVRARLLGEDGAVAFAPFVVAELAIEELVVEGELAIENASVDEMVIEEVVAEVESELEAEQLVGPVDRDVADEMVVIGLADEVEVVDNDPSDEVVLLTEVADAFAATAGEPEAVADVVLVAYETEDDPVSAELDAAVADAVASMEAEAAVADAVADMEAEAAIEDAVADLETALELEDAVAEVEANSRIEEAVAELDAEASIEDAVAEVGSEGAFGGATLEFAADSDFDAAVAELESEPQEDAESASYLSRRNRWVHAVGTPAAHDLWSEAFDEALRSSTAPTPAVAEASVEPEPVMESDAWWQADQSDGHEPSESEPVAAEASLESTADTWGAPEAWSSDTFDGEWVEGAPSIDGSLAVGSSADSNGTEPEFEWIAPDPDGGAAKPAPAASAQSGSGKRRKH